MASLSNSKERLELKLEDPASSDELGYLVVSLQLVSLSRLPPDVVAGKCDSIVGQLVGDRNLVW